MHPEWVCYSEINGLLVSIKIERVDTMSMLLRSLLVLCVASVLMVGCGNKEETVPVEAAPAAVVVPAAEAPAAEAPAAEAAQAEGPGGYVPSADELVPGITLDAAATQAAPAEAEAEPAEPN